MTMKSTRKEIEFRILEFGVVLKGIYGILDFLAAIVLTFIHETSVYRLVKGIFSQEIAHDPNDLIANSMLNFLQNLSLGTKEFIAMYLLIHGIVNLYIFFIVFMKKYKQFPIAITILLILTIYQIFRFAYNHSLALFAITLIDMMIIYLLARYLKKKALQQ